MGIGLEQASTGEIEETEREELDDALARVGAMLAPIALVAVGTRLSWPSRASWGPLVAGLGYKLLAAPALAWVLMSGMAADGLPLRVTVLEAGMAPAATAASTARDLASFNASSRPISAKE